MYKRILVAADGSKHSLRAAKEVQFLLDGTEGMVDVVFVINGSTSKQDVLRHVNSWDIEMSRKEKVKEIATFFEEKAILYNVHILRGEPGPSIVSFANKGEYDCLVIGSRGLNNLQTLVLGSVSHKVMKRVKCPVMIVKS